MAEQLTRTLQENVLTLVAYSNEQGRIIINMIKPDLFEGDYRVIAEGAFEFWRQHGEAPKDHTPDLVSDILDDPHNRKAATFRRVLGAMYDLSQHINAEYVMTKLRTFVRMQTIKNAINDSAERIHARQEMAIEEIEELWNDLLRKRQVGFEPGLRLDETDRLVGYLRQRNDEFVTGIGELDKRFIVPYRKAVMLFIGPPKIGKSWLACCIGKANLLKRKKVVHITLEMSEEEYGLRYYQSILSVSKREAKVAVRNLIVDEKGRLQKLEEDEITPEFTFESKFLDAEFEQAAEQYKHLVKNLVIKAFPPRSLTMNGLRAYLDNLEAVEGFIPDMLILDYIGIVSTDAKNHRITLGRAMEEFRAICVERNIAGVTFHQASKLGAMAEAVHSTHIAEDFSMIGTADQVATITRTKAEKQYGLARVYVTNARGEQDEFGVLITQALALGQFCLSSMYLGSEYFKLIKKLEPDDDKHTEESEDEDDEDE